MRIPPQIDGDQAGSPGVVLPPQFFGGLPGLLALGRQLLRPCPIGGIDTGFPLLGEPSNQVPHGPHRNLQMFGDLCSRPSFLPEIEDRTT